MGKRKAIICTILFGIVIGGIFTATILIENKEYGFSLYDIISPVFVGAWVGERVMGFYKWLRGEEK